MRLGRATFETTKRLGDLERSLDPKVSKAKIVDVATRHGLDLRENVLRIGQTGVGKSHVAQALGERARSGALAAVRDAQRMLSQLRASPAALGCDMWPPGFTVPEPLIVDEPGPRPLEGEEPLACRPTR